MSAIERTEADKLLRRVAGSLPATCSSVVYFDGDATKSLMFKSLPGNEAIVDISRLYHPGIAFGPTFQNAGNSPVTIELSLAPASLAALAHLEGNEAEIALYLNTWIPLATLSPGDQKAMTREQIFYLAKLTFTAGSSGELHIMSV